MSDLAFHYDRTAAAGAAEAAPTATTSPLVQQLLSAEQMRGEHTDALMLLCTAVAINYELGIWDPATSAFVVIATGSLIAGTPSIIPWPYQGVQVYLRHTNVTAGDSRLRMLQIRAPSAQLAATLAAVATEVTLAAASAKLPATLGQKAAAASMSIVPASDSGLATATKQDEAKAVADEVTGASKAYSADGTLTASDATEYSPPLKVVWATGAGSITAMLEDDTVSVVTFAVTANERVSEFRIKKIMAATTATGLSGAQ